MQYSLQTFDKIATFLSEFLPAALWVKNDEGRKLQQTAANF